MRKVSALNDLLFGAVDQVFDKECLLFDHAMLKSCYLLCGKLEKRGYCFVENCEKKNELDVLFNAINNYKHVLKSVHCDNTREFLSVKKKCEEVNVSFFPSSLSRDKFKGKQVAVVKIVKEIFSQVNDRMSKNQEYKC